MVWRVTRVGAKWFSDEGVPSRRLWRILAVAAVFAGIVLAFLDHVPPTIPGSDVFRSEWTPSTNRGAVGHVLGFLLFGMFGLLYLMASAAVLVKGIRDGPLPLLVLLGLFGTIFGMTILSLCGAIICRALAFLVRGAL
jgi:hypothetical protein